MKTNKKLAIALVAAFISFGACKNKDNEHSSEKDLSLIANDTVTSDPVVYEEYDSIIPTNPNTKTNNWDKMLDDYEEYIDQYIVFYNRSLDGDMEALAAYPEFLQKTEALQRSLQKAQNSNDFTSEHLTRMTKIQNKMLNMMEE